MKKAIRKIVAAALSLSLCTGMVALGSTVVSAESSTGVGLAAHALRAYREGWSYVWGGTSYGAVDCSGLIWTYNGVGGCRFDMLASSDCYGYVSNGIPNIHGLGLHSPGHVGVYIGSGAAVDARDEWSGVVYHNVYKKSWVEWFKIAGVNYPSNGWVLLDGDSYYYENGEYITNTSRTLDGVTYSFNSAGVSDIAPPSSAYEATDYSSSSAPAVVQTAPDPEPEPEPQPEPEPEPEPEQPKAEEPKPEEKPAEPEKPEEKNEILASYGDEDTETRDRVQRIQKRLYALGYLSDEPTGFYGDDTVEAVVNFQTLNGFEVTGMTDEKTWEFMKTDEAKSYFPELSVGDFDDGSKLTITKLQTKLNELKYYYDDITGFYGELTASAVKQFQTDNDLEATGVADEATQKLLLRGEPKANPNDGTLAYGQSGKKVAELQKKLIELRYLSGIVNDRFDDATLDAVHLYQKTAGIEEADFLTADQIASINDGSAPKSPYFDILKYGHTGEDVTKLQQRLYSLGYYTGKTSGTFNTAVEESVKSFQKAMGLEQTGIVDENTAELLKTEAQRETAKVADVLVVKTADITDNALAHIAETPSLGEVSITTQTTGDLVRTGVILGAVIIFALFLTLIFVVELRRRRRLASAEAEIVRDFKRNF